MCLEKKKPVTEKVYQNIFVKITIIPLIRLKGPVFIQYTLSAAQNEWYVDP